MTLEDARRVIAAAEKKAKENGQPMNIAVADEGATLFLTCAWTAPGSAASTFPSTRPSPLGLSISRQKTWPRTHNPADNSFGIHVSNHGKIMIFAGGIPLKKNGKVVGAVGVSGGSGDQDHSVAEAGAAAF